MSVGFESAMNKMTMAAAPSMRPKSVPNAIPEGQCEKGWYISPFDGKKRMTADNPALVEQDRAELERIIEEESSTISPEEETQIRAEVRAVMNQKFEVGRGKLESISVAQNEASVKSGAATSDVDVIDLISQSIASLQKSQPTIILGSPISVARNPSHAGNGGSTPGFSHLSFASHPSPPPQPVVHWFS